MSFSSSSMRDRSFPGINDYGSLKWIVLLILAGLPDSGRAQSTNTWTNTSNVNAWFDVGSNWSPVGPPGAIDKALFNAPATYQVQWDGFTGDRTIRYLEVNDGSNVAFRNMTSAARYLEVTGISGVPAYTDFFVSGTNTHLSLQGLALSTSSGQLLDGASLTVDGSFAAPSFLSISRDYQIEGTLNLLSGGQMFVGIDANLDIGFRPSSSGNVNVSGQGSGLDSLATMYIGGSGNGTLNINDGGVVFAGAGADTNYIGYFPSGTGNVIVSGDGSGFYNRGNLTLGIGHGSMTIASGGRVNVGNDDASLGTGVSQILVGGSSSSSGRLAVVGGSDIDNSGHAAIGATYQGQAIVSGTNSRWLNGGDLMVGTGANGLLEIDNGGLVTAGGTTTIGSMGSVSLAGGRFEFGTMALSNFARVTGTSGSVAGALIHSGNTNVATLTSLQNTSLDLTGVSLENSGKLYGTADLGGGLTNLSGGRVETIGSERMQFAGPSHTNQGRINAFGGQIAFAGELANVTGGEINNYGHSFVADRVGNGRDGLISGRGQFVAFGGWDNSGVMALSSGTSDIVGDVNNYGTGRIVTSGLGTTTFYGDVVHNGAEIRTAAGSSTVFFGDLTGAGPFTGTGTLFMEGDLRPGNSPGTIRFEGNLVFGSSATLRIELGGLDFDEYDQLQIDGDLSLGNSGLSVSLWEDFELGDDMEFLITDVGGQVSGTFDGLSEGSSLGRFGRHELFITYQGIKGNAGVGLYTLSAVPEPSSLLFLLIASGLALKIRRARTCVIASMSLTMSLGIWTPLFGQGRTDQIAISGQAAPDENGTFSLFNSGTPVINSSGQVAFWTRLAGTSGGTADDRALMFFNGNQLIQAVREGQQVPVGNGTFSNFTAPVSLNDSGSFSYWGEVSGTGPSDNQGIYRWDGFQSTQLVRKGETVPGGNGVFSSLGSPNSAEASYASFFAGLSGTTGGTTDNQALYRSTLGAIDQVARTGQVAPGGGTFSAFGLVPRPEINDQGAVSFFARLSGTSGGTTDNEGIYLNDRISTAQIARKGQIAPDGNGTYFIFEHNTLLNNGNQVAFTASLSGTIGGGVDDRAIFLGSAAEVHVLAREGQLAPDGNGAFASLAVSTVGGSPLNDLGQVVFSATLNGSLAGASDNSGLFRADENGIEQIARKGQAAPDGSGIFDGIGLASLANTSGATAFYATLSPGSPTPQSGFYIGDGIDLLKIARTGDLVSGSAVSSLYEGFNNSVNDHGQVAYRASLADGRQVVQTYTPDLHWRSSVDGDWDDQSNWTLGLKPALVHDVDINPGANSNVYVNGPASDAFVRSLQIGAGLGQAQLHLQNDTSLHVANGVEIAANGTLDFSGSLGWIDADVNNNGNVEVFGGGTLSFTGDVVQNGTLTIEQLGRTSSVAEVHGEFSGNNGFVGGGTLKVLGSLSPGNSTASVLFDGNLELGSLTDTHIELGGLNTGEFDQMVVTGNLNLDGRLLVSLYESTPGNPWVLAPNQEYIIGLVNGTSSGQFQDELRIPIADGGLVGNYGGTNLYLRYTAGDGNDIALYTAVPEPSSILFLLMVSVLAVRGRRTRPRVAC